MYMYLFYAQKPVGLMQIFYKKGHAQNNFKIWLFDAMYF